MKYVEIVRATSSTNVTDIEEGSEKYTKALLLRPLLISGLNEIAGMESLVLRKLAKGVLRNITDNHLDILLSNVPTLAMTVLGTSKGALPLVLAPAVWPDWFANNHQIQIGAIIFVSSQVQDFFNKNLTSDFMVKARSFEAEYLKTLDKNTLSTYQLSVLEQFPNGLDPSFHLAPSTLN